MQHLDVPASINDDIARVDALIRKQLESQEALLQAAGRYLLTGRQRTLAALTLLTAQLGHQVDRGVLHAAAAVELIQHATHIHSDLIADAHRRQADAAPRDRWSGDVALMVGDYLFALAASEMALAPDARIIDYYSRAVMSITESKLTPVVMMTPLAAARRHYLDVIGAQTAVLFEAACKAGMVCGGGSEREILQLGRFGYTLGLAYAIGHDVHDLATNRGHTALPPITLPLLYAIEAGAHADLAATVDRPSADPELLVATAAEIERLGGNRRASADAASFAQQALDMLALLATSEARLALETFVRTLTPPTNSNT